ncbi:AI-2E family transporter [Desulfoluna limicola]|uniref:AI-2E family transporter n=1 Tax=Desulfoluna limicola TaxID=2810562 RepID=A0ABM7PGZ4_9BACT|nr:AI-2E family transporter [Desulfoluna limicola]BCS96833.1 AI-2E family transporter [Desulfoluna limicola]
MLDKTPRDLILWFFLILFIISLFLLGKLLWPFISVIVMGAVVSGVFYPVYRLLSKKIPSRYASFLTCCLIFVVLFVPIVLFVGVLANEIHNFYVRALSADVVEAVKQFFVSRNILGRINAILGNFDLHLTFDEVMQPIADMGKSVGLKLLNQANAIASHLLKFVIHFFLMLIIIYYLLLDGNRLLRYIVDLSPLPDDQDIKLMNKFKDMAGAVLVVNGISGMIQGVVGGLVFTFFGFRSPVLWGVAMAFFAFLPIVGIGIIFMPAAIWLFFEGRMGAGIAVMVIYVILSGGVEYLFKPAVVGKRIKMHTLLVFLGIIGGLQLFGILGIIYGPLVITFFLTLSDIYNKSYKSLVEPEGRKRIHFDEVSGEIHDE